MQTGNDGGEMVTGINVAPLVDVCLVLVIIFMVTAPLLNQTNLPVTLPKAKTKEGEEKSNVTITITKDNHWALNEKEYPFDQLPPALERKIARSPDRLVVIRADHEATHGKLMDAMAMAKTAGARSITIATEQKK